VKIEHQVANVTTPDVLITAHGASQQTMQRARGHGLNVVEATCPLVQFAHRAVAALVRDGFHPIIIGRRDHVEVRGIIEDLKAFDVVLTEEDVTRLEARPRFGVAAQTTQPIDRVRHLVELIRHRFPNAEVRFADTVCQPTKHRQSAAIELAQQCDVVVVIGGAHSNNTRELMATCLRHCERVYHVQSVKDLHATWFRATDTIGITAGTSTPDPVIDEVQAWLEDFGDFQARLSQHMVSECA
jgi:4-hydroxy-3-methylbut-2-enyl diphosphate reductase